MSNKYERTTSHVDRNHAGFWTCRRKRIENANILPSTVKNIRPDISTLFKQMTFGSIHANTNQNTLLLVAAESLNKKSHSSDILCV